LKPSFVPPQRPGRGLAIFSPRWPNRLWGHGGQNYTRAAFFFPPHANFGRPQLHASSTKRSERFRPPRSIPVVLASCGRLTENPGNPMFSLQATLAGDPVSYDLVNLTFPPSSCFVALNRHPPVSLEANRRWRLADPLLTPSRLAVTPSPRFVVTEFCPRTHSSTFRAVVCRGPRRPLNPA